MRYAAPLIPQKAILKNPIFPVFCNLSTLDFSSNRQLDGDFFTVELIVRLI